MVWTTLQLNSSHNKQRVTNLYLNETYLILISLRSTTFVKRQCLLAGEIVACDKNTSQRTSHAWGKNSSHFVVHKSKSNLSCKPCREYLFVRQLLFHSFLSQIAAQRKRPKQVITEDSARKTILTRMGYLTTTACVQRGTPVRSVKPKNKVNRSKFDSS